MLYTSVVLKYTSAGPSAYLDPDSSKVRQGPYPSSHSNLVISAQAGIEWRWLLNAAGGKA